MQFFFALVVSLLYFSQQKALQSYLLPSTLAKYRCDTPDQTNSAAWKCIDGCNQILTYSIGFLLCSTLHSATQYVCTYGACTHTHKHTLRYPTH